MKAKIFQALVGMLLVALIVVVRERTDHATDHHSQMRFVRGPSSVQTRNDAAILNGFLEKVENSWEGRQKPQPSKVGVQPRGQ